MLRREGVSSAIPVVETSSPGHGVVLGGAPHCRIRASSRGLPDSLTSSARSCPSRLRKSPTAVVASSNSCTCPGAGTMRVCRCAQGVHHAERWSLALRRRLERTSVQISPGSRRGALRRSAAGRPRPRTGGPAGPVQAAGERMAHGLLDHRGGSLHGAEVQAGRHPGALEGMDHLFSGDVAARARCERASAEAPTEASSFVMPASIAARTSASPAPRVS